MFATAIGSEVAGAQHAVAATGKCETLALLGTNPGRHMIEENAYPGQFSKMGGPFPAPLIGYYHHWGKSDEQRHAVSDGLW